LGNDFSQNYTATGLGAKYQITRAINLETIYSKFIRGNDTGLGQSFNLGLRAILNSIFILLYHLTHQSFGAFFIVHEYLTFEL
jgi:hypothetical protein